LSLQFLCDSEGINDAPILNADQRLADVIIARSFFQGIK
jgi:hypothetical protein